MYTLDKVIKEFKSIIKKTDNEMTKTYYEIIVKYLLLEQKHKDIVLLSNKPIYHYFQYSLPRIDKDYFLWLYSPYNPVRFAVETFDSIEEIRIELGRG